MSTTRRKRHNPEEIARKLRDADAMLNADNDAATENHARLWSLIASCERHQVDPQRNLTGVLATIGKTPAEELAQFLPDAWKRDDAAQPRPGETLFCQLLTTSANNLPFTEQTQSRRRITEEMLLDQNAVRRLRGCQWNGESSSKNRVLKYAFVAFFNLAKRQPAPRATSARREGAK